MASFMRFVDDLAPRAVLIENVPALAWRRTSHVLTWVRQQLQARGYAHDVIVAHAEGYGVPQLRRRLFVAAQAGTDTIKWPVPNHEILTPAFLKHQPQPDTGRGVARRAPYTTHDAIADLPTTVSEHPDDNTPYTRPAQSDVARWVRGTVSVQELVGSTTLAPSPHERLE